MLGLRRLARGCGERRFGRRQVIDLPEPKPVVTEHRAHAVTCTCGQTTTAPFPEGGAGAGVVRAQGAGRSAYLLGRQHIPNRRVADLFSLAFC